MLFDKLGRLAVGAVPPPLRRQAHGRRSRWASGQAYSFYGTQWEDHWWLEPETWASGGFGG